MTIDFNKIIVKCPSCKKETFGIWETDLAGTHRKCAKCKHYIDKIK